MAALDALFFFFMEHPDRMPRHYAELARNEPRHRVVCDYIAGMTDHFLLRQCRELLGAQAGRAVVPRVAANYVIVRLVSARRIMPVRLP